ncbi:MAG: aspartate aminotransferase family protein [Acidobacteria bacterium]|nr:aspartate aminotransferase family protein [Acidobacteriota bacterium]
MTMPDALLRRALELAEEFRGRDPHLPVFPRITVEELRRALGGPAPEHGEPAERVLNHLVRGAEPGIVASAGPRFFGFVIGGSLPVATAADWMTSVWDQNGPIWSTSPAASVVEEVAAQWLLEFLDLPRHCSVGFVTGGGTANFTCLAAARNHLLRQAGWDVEADGLQAAPRIHVLIGEEAHVTILTALRMVGLGERSAIRIKADDQGRMLPGELRRALAPLSGPILVCTQAGDVNSGHFDPFFDLIQAVRERAGWMHVDGAFGLWARISERLKPLTHGAELADSWTVDAHKWLNVPYDCGLAITAHPQAHMAAMGSTAAYIIPGQGRRDNFSFVPEFSRRARGFTVYAALRHLGRSGMRDLVECCCARARQMARLLAPQPGVAILNDVVLNQVLVRFRDDDDFTRAVIARVQQDGTCWLGGTTWKGNAAMRISVSNWSTTERDIELSANAILNSARIEAPG